MKKRKYWIEWASFVGLWLVISVVFTWVLQVHIKSFIHNGDLAEQAAENMMAAYMFSDVQFIESAIFGFCFGNFFFLIHRLTELYGFYTWPFWKVVGLKSLAYVAGLLVIFVFMYLLLANLDFFPKEFVEFQPLTHITDPWLDPLLEPTMVMLVVLSFFIVLHNLFIQLSKNFGEGKIWLILLGHYRKPRVENRIFLFIDLKSSTAYAEELGHIRYSQLIQDCFKDLNHVAKKYSAEIYQYVGDEAVITWETKECKNGQGFLRMFFAFLERIHKKREQYHYRYGLIPQFKAGGHVGEITVAEVGYYKREIAYHGDVVNTAARIQGVANSYGKYLLFSEELVSLLPPGSEEWKVEEIGYVQLKGKRGKVKVFAIESTSPNLNRPVQPMIETN